jgi:hypothetical protein
MVEKDSYINLWRDYHKSLHPHEANRFKEKIEYVLGISQSAFYRKIKYPRLFLSIAEKWAISRIYHLDEIFLFPELKEIDFVHSIPVQRTHAGRLGKASAKPKEQLQ